MATIRPAGIDLLTGRSAVIEDDDIVIYSGGQRIKRTATDVDYAILLTDYYIGVTLTDTTKTMTLPSAVDAGSGGTFVVKDESGNAGTNNIIVTPQPGNIIEGDVSFLINVNYGAATVVSDGVASWFVV